MLEANINVLWQNLIALNSSILRENEEQRAELLQTKELLQKVSVFAGKLFISNSV